MAENDPILDVYERFKHLDRQSGPEAPGASSTPRPGEPLSCTPLAPGRGAGRYFYPLRDPTIRLERPSGLRRCVNGEAEGQRPPAKRPRTKAKGPGETLRTENETVNNGDGKTKAEKRPDHARPARPEWKVGECFEFRSSPDDSFYLSMERGPFVKEPQRVK